MTSRALSPTTRAPLAAVLAFVVCTIGAACFSRVGRQFEREVLAVGTYEITEGDSRVLEGVGRVELVRASTYEGGGYDFQFHRDSTGPLRVVISRAAPPSTGDFPIRPFGSRGPATSFIGQTIDLLPFDSGSVRLETSLSPSARHASVSGTFVFFVDAHGGYGTRDSSIARPIVVRGRMRMSAPTLPAR